MKAIVFAIFIGLIPLPSNATDFAITMDDPNSYERPYFSAQDRDINILEQLKMFNTKVALFVCGTRIDSTPGKKILKRWDEAGHLIGNHTYSHFNYNSPSRTFKSYAEDVLKVESLIKDLNNFEKVFRFPFLKSGESNIKRDKIRNFIKSNGYTLGYVTVDASDWYISDRLEKKLEADPNSNIQGFKDYYLNHMWERAKYYDDLALKTIGRSPRHTLLIHHNLLNALFLKDLIKHFQSKGWNLIDAKDAFKDPIYSLEPDLVPSGEGIIWAIAKEQGIEGLRYPAEDSVYEKPMMDKLGL